MLVLESARDDFRLGTVQTMQKIKVLHMTPYVVKNGIYQYIFNHLKFIDRKKYEFSFLMQNPQELRETAEYLQYKFEIKSFSIPQRENPIRFCREITEILSDGYDVLHLHTSYWRGFMIEEVAMKLGMPKVIVHAHSSRIDQRDSNEREKQLKIHERLKREFNETYATDFWACSTEAADWLYGPNISRQKIKIMPNAIDVSRYLFHKDNRKKYREKSGLERKFVLGHTGRFEYQKNHRFLIHVFAEVHRRIPSAALVLIGEGPEEAEIRKQVSEQGLQEDVLFMGWRDDVDKWLQAFDLYCLPSWFEGLPIGLIEAQAAGLRCITSSFVTREARITDLVEFLELDAECWRIKIVEWSGAYERKDQSDQMKGAGFDLKQQVKLLEKEYSSKTAE